MRPLVFLALCVLSSPLFAGVAHANNDEIQRYADSDYTYCDAKVLAAFWGEDVWSAKARIGRKIGWGDDRFLAQMRSQAGVQSMSNPATQCQFYETMYSYKDAENLSKAWKISVSEAKATLARKASVNGEEAVRKDVLNGLTATQGGGAAPLVDKCHRKMLGHLWAQNTAEVKATVQRKISMGGTQFLKNEIAESRKLASATERAACSFWDTPYTYKDAEKLAGRWGMSVSQAKGFVEQKYKYGLEDWLRSEAAAVGVR